MPSRDCGEVGGRGMGMGLPWWKDTPHLEGWGQEKWTKGGNGAEEVHLAEQGQRPEAVMSRGIQTTPSPSSGPAAVLGARVRIPTVVWRRWHRTALAVTTFGGSLDVAGVGVTRGVLHVE